MQPATFLSEHFLFTPSTSTPSLRQLSPHANDLGSNDSGRRRASLAAIHANSNLLPPPPPLVPIYRNEQQQQKQVATDSVHANVSPRILVSDTNNRLMSPTEETQLQHQGDAAVKEDLITGRPSYNSQDNFTGLSFSSTTLLDGNDDRKNPMPPRSFTSLLSADADHPPTTSDCLPPLSSAAGNGNSRLLQAMRRAKKQQRRGSVGEGMVRQRQKMLSPPIQPRLTKSSTHKFTLTPRNSNSRPVITTAVDKVKYQGKKEEEDDDDDGIPWDPHIDAFEILRAKITGITRTMQEFHVHELFQDELSERAGRDLKRERHHTYGGSGWLDAQRRRLSTAGAAAEINGKDADDARSIGHRRIRSHGSLFLDLSKSPPSPLRLAPKEEEKAINSPPPPPPAPAADASSSKGNADPWSHLKIDEDFEQEIRPTSPNLTSLFLTTNSLINSRLDELSETASIASSCDLEDASAAEWRTQFLDLVSACITQSEELESLSTEMLGTERRVRELMVLNESVDEELKEREKIYEERIRECEDVAKQQMLMIDTLTDLMADLQMKLDHLNRKSTQEKSNNNYKEQSTSEDDEQENDRWDFRKSVADILNVDSKDDLVQKMRWEVGMFVGGGVGTGSVLHSYEGRLGGIEMIIAGTGTTEETASSSSSSPLSPSDRPDKQHHRHHQTKHSTYLPPTLRHGRFQHHHYVLHILPKDRKTKFVMIPRAHWVPDQLVDQCQFESNKRCSTRFSFFERRHHCRRCGQVVCQRHSSNKLPLFATSASRGEWSRVCDGCFRFLITADDSSQ